MMKRMGSKRRSILRTSFFSAFRRSSGDHAAILADHSTSSDIGASKW